MNGMPFSRKTAGSWKEIISRRQIFSWPGLTAVMAVIVFFAVVPTAHAADWYVDGGVSSSGNGTSWAEAFKTIDEAITAASAGDNVNVASGIYNERLVLDKQLTLTGAGSDSTIVQPADTPTPGIYDVEIDASGTIIEDFQFDFNGDDDARSGNGIVVSDMNEPPVTDVQILDNKIYTGHANTGIQTGKYSDVSGLTISGNTFYGDSDGMGEGVYVNPYSGAGDVTITDNEFYGYLFSGVSIEASNVQVSGNMIDSDLAQGVYGVRFIDLTGGESYDNVLISNNRIQNVQYGISVGTSTEVGSTLTATIDSNTLSNNDIGLRVRYGPDLAITHNSIAGNTNYGIYNEGSGPVIAENNWWGDPSGPYHPIGNPTGTGDAVSDNVDYDPWSLESLPIAEFMANPTSGIKPLSVQFTDLSSGTITSYFWNFSDGYTSTEQNPVHQYQVVGTYTVRLTVTGPGGSTYRGKVDYIHVLEAPPVANFSANPTSGMEPLSVQFTDLSAGGPITSYSWNFGDGQTSTQQSPLHQYQTGGDYTVQLTVTGPGGSDMMERVNYIHVDYAPPIADFTANPMKVPRFTDVQFTDLSSGAITSYSWNFGDGQTSTAQNPLHQYQDYGDYTVQLTVTGPGGSDVMQKIDYIHVGPVADFSANPTSGDGPLSVQFTDLSGGTITTYFWEFGDGQTSADQNPLHEYQAAGDYTVRLTVTGPGGSDVMERIDYIDVWEPPPAPAFTATPTAGLLPLDVQFIDLSTGVIVAYYWEFGDGQTSTAQNPLHQYQAVGNYTVRLTATGPVHFEVMERVNYIHVGHMKWWATAYGHSGFDQALAIQNAPDGGYIVAGMTDSFGAGGRDVWMSKVDPDATISWQKTYGGTGDDEAHAVDQTTDGGYIVAGESNGDLWLLRLDANGDVGPAYPGTWQKTYGGIGDDVAYAVRETADGGYIAAGCTSSFGEGGYDVWVLKLDSGGTIAWEKTYGGTGDDGGRAIQLTPDGEYIVAGWTESFGEGSVGFPDIWVLRLDQDGQIGGCAGILDSNAMVSETMVVPQDTNAPVVGTSINASGTTVSPQDASANASTVCSESAIPIANFSADPTDGKNPLIVQFTDLSTGEIEDYYWKFGDGDTSTSTDQHPIHQYQSIGTYDVALRVRGPAGLDREKKLGYINVTPGLPSADFAGSPTVGTPPFTVTFVDKSSEQWGPIDTRIWDFGDGIVREYDSPTVYHAYGGGADAWTVSLTVIGPGGSDTKTKIDYIHLPNYIPSHPVIESIKPRRPEPGKIIKIIGYNFGVNQGDSIVHINKMTFDSTKARIKQWGDTLIKIKVPFTNKSCQWFKDGGGEYRKRQVWVTVGGGDSEKMRIKVLKPDTCP